MPNVCAAVVDEDPVGESQQVRDDMDVDESTASESQHVQDEPQHVKAEMQLGLLEESSKRLGSSITDYGTQACLCFLPPSLCPTSSGS